MLDLDDVTYRAFRDEIKVAARLQGALSGLGAGLGLGAVAGGAINAARGYTAARDRGEGVGGSLLHGALAAPQGAAVGAAAGAGLGAAAGSFAPRLGEALANLPGVGSPVRFAQRQVHGFTGWQPAGGIEAIGGGAAGARAARAAAKGSGEHLDRGLRAAEAVQEAGLTSIPGFVRGLARDPKGTIQKGFAEQWHNSGPAGKVLSLGLPALEAGHAAVSDEAPDGPGKAERIGRGLLPAAAGMVTSALPITAQLAVGAGLGAVGAGAGRVVDRLRGRRPIEAAVPPPYKHEDAPPPELRAGPGVMHGGTP